MARAGARSGNSRAAYKHGRGNWKTSNRSLSKILRVVARTVSSSQQKRFGRLATGPPQNSSISSSPACVLAAGSRASQRADSPSPIAENRDGGGRVVTGLLSATVRGFDVPGVFPTIFTAEQDAFQWLDKWSQRCLLSPRREFLAKKVEESAETAIKTMVLWDDSQGWLRETPSSPAQIFDLIE